VWRETSPLVLLCGFAPSRDTIFANSDLLFQPPVQKWKRADAVDPMGALEGRELAAIAGAEAAVDIPHPLELLARKIEC